MELDIVYWDHSYNKIILFNLCVVMGLFLSLRLFSGTIAHINASDELLKRDNPAFGISLAGVAFAVTLLLSGTIYGDYEQDILKSGITTAAYGLCGITLMAITRLIFDKIALSEISLRDEIKKGNMAVAIADTSNVIAVAIIIRAIMIWIPDHSIENLTALLAAYVVSQVILTLATILSLKLFAMINKGRSIPEELQNNNVAIALSFAGKKIGTAFAISIATNLVVYEIYDIKTFFLPWILVSLCVILIIKLLSIAAERIVLFRVNIKEEIIGQKNLAVGALQGIIYLSLAILLAEI